MSYIHVDINMFIKYERDGLIRPLKKEQWGCESIDYQVIFIWTTRIYASGTSVFLYMYLELD